MNRFHVPTVVAMALLAAIAFAPTTAHADFKCTSPNGSIEMRACAIAAAGPDALRRFVQRSATSTASTTGISCGPSADRKAPPPPALAGRYAKRCARVPEPAT